MSKDNLYKVLLAPRVTEKTTLVGDASNQYVFKVAPEANKAQIKEAVQSLYRIKIKKVNTLITPKGNKKAYVKLTSDLDALDVANKIGIM